MFTSFTVLRQNSPKDKTQASFFCLQKVKGIREQLKTTAFCTFFQALIKLITSAFVYKQKASPSF